MFSKYVEFFQKFWFCKSVMSVVWLCSPHRLYIVCKWFHACSPSSALPLSLSDFLLCIIKNVMFCFKQHAEVQSSPHKTHAMWFVLLFMISEGL